jgi:LytS/YehU family sensor histidine kinase
MLVGLAGMAAGLLVLTHRPSPDLPAPTKVAATVGWLRDLTLGIGGVNTANVVVFFTCAGVAAWQWVVGRDRAAAWLASGWVVCGLLRLQLGLQWQGTLPVVIHPSTGLLVLSMIMPLFFLVSASARFRAVATERQRALRLERMLADARLRALRYQMNPHFLFNSLNSAMGLLLEDASRVHGFLQLLARFLRSSLDGNTRGLVSMERELQTTRDYLAIEKVRFEERLKVDINIPESLMVMEVPEMTLQPLLENALRHGSRNAAKVLCVRVSAWVEDGRMHVEVANTGRLRARAGRATWTGSAEGGLGLANLQERLALVHAGRASLELGEADGWVKVRLLLPVKPASIGPDAAEEAIP